MGAGLHALGALPNIETALYFSTATFSTIGYGDVVLSSDWRLLGSLEGISGLLLIGWSTAYLVAASTRHGPLRVGEHSMPCVNRLLRVRPRAMTICSTKSARPTKWRSLYAQAILNGSGSIELTSDDTGCGHRRARDSCGPGHGQVSTRPTIAASSLGCTRSHHPPHPGSERG